MLKKLMVLGLFLLSTSAFSAENPCGRGKGKSDTVGKIVFATLYDAWNFQPVRNEAVVTFAENNCIGQSECKFVLNECQNGKCTIIGNKTSLTLPDPSVGSAKSLAINYCCANDTQMHLISSIEGGEPLTIKCPVD